MDLLFNIPMTLSSCDIADLLVALHRRDLFLRHVSSIRKQWEHANFGLQSQRAFEFRHRNPVRHQDMR